MTSSTGMKIVVVVLLLISIALAVDLYRTKAAARIPKEFAGVLTSDPPGTQLSSKISIAASETYTTSPSSEEYTVDPSIEYSDFTYRIRSYAVQGQILQGKFQRSK
jgi:hypothetical protein